MLSRPSADPSDPPLLVLRAEGGPGRGVGHLARCLALAQAWQDRGGRAVLAAADEVPEPWRSRYEAEAVQVADPGSLAAADWWLVDGYDLDTTDAPDEARLARIDDHGESPDDAVDLVLDQNLGATGERYRLQAPDVLAGTRYALLRREVVDGALAAEDRQVSDDPRRIVVAMGGTPSKAVQAATDQIASAIERSGSGLDVRVLDGSQATPTVWPETDVALSAAGSTVWELCLFGVPSVVVSVAPNQEPLGLALDDAGAATYVGRLDDIEPTAVAAAVLDLATSPDRRHAQVEEMDALIDGVGAGRVATRLRGSLVTLEAAGPADLLQVHELNNEPSARAASLIEASIPMADHERWYAARMDDPDSFLWLAEDPAGRLLGLVRFQVDGDAAEIGVVVAPEQRGRGWAAPVIDAGVRRLFAEAPAVTTVDAQVKAANRASWRAFVDADFDLRSSSDDEVLRYARHHVRPADV